MINKDEGYTLIETIVVLAAGSLMITGLFLINSSFFKSWQDNKLQASLQQELRVSMNTVVNKLNSAVKIKEITGQKVIILNSEAQKEEIFYLEGQGLCLDDKRNKISPQVTELILQRIKKDLLIIKLEAKRKDVKLTLETSVKLNEDQL